MNKNVSKIIEDLITECECDNRIESGIFDIYNADHLVVLSEHMAGCGISEPDVEDMIESIVMDEGKHPDRQAYNKEGWLVTFPSKEYRDAAIKKGTHAISDPTHGKGGMNLYYKRKGKQKRQTAQGQSSTKQQPTQQPAQQTSQQPAQPSATNIDQDTPQRSPEKEAEFQKRRTSQKISPRKETDAIAKYLASQDPNFKLDGEPSTTSTSEKEPAKKQPSAPAIDVPVVTTPPEQYSSISKKFAAKKGWKAEPYGEYRDAEGNTVAVVGLSGEVVPVKSVDRDEYKIFAEKSMI